MPNAMQKSICELSNEQLATLKNIKISKEQLSYHNENDEEVDKL